MDKKQVDRYHTIDFIKGICIIIVIFTHCNWEDMERLKYMFPFWIDMAVPIFMICSGLVCSKSFQRNNFNVEDVYSGEKIIDKILRFTVPFFIIFLFEEIMLNLCGDMKFSLPHMVRNFLIGGRGPGSYYYPIMIQFIFWFPIIYFVIKKNDLQGLNLCFFMNFMYELLQRVYGVSDSCYRLLIFRYTLVIAFGCYLAIGKKKLNKIYLLIMMLVGVIYIYLFKYTNHAPWITIHWTGTSFFACLYILPIAMMLINSNFHNGILELLGRASYNIFLVQMFYYAIGICSFIFENRILQIIFNIVVCCALGIVFYYIEGTITRNIRKKVKNKLFDR